MTRPVPALRSALLTCAAAVTAVALAAAPAQAAVVSTTPDRTPTFNGAVLATVYAGDVVYVGGEFTAAVVNGRSVARGRLAAINARTGELLGWAPQADRTVRAITVSGGAVYVAGDFTRIGDTRRDSLARLDGRTGAVHRGFAHRVDGVPYAVTAGGGRLYLGGAFTGVDGAERGGLAAFDLATGALDRRWAPTAEDRVAALVHRSDRVYVGGRFDTIDGVSGSSRIAALDPETGAVDRGFRPVARVIAHGIAVGSRGVYVAHGGAGGRVVAYDFAGRSQWTLTFDGDAQAVGVLGDVVYVGGHFDAACRSARTGDHGDCQDGSEQRIKIAAVDPAGNLLPWTADGNGVSGVHAVATSAGLGAVAFGGAFTTINGTARERFAQFRG